MTLILKRSSSVISYPELVLETTLMSVSSTENHLTMNNSYSEYMVRKSALSLCETYAGHNTHNAEIIKQCYTDTTSKEN